MQYYHAMPSNMTDLEPYPCKLQPSLAFLCRKLATCALCTAFSFVSMFLLLHRSAVVLPPTHHLVHDLLQSSLQVLHRARAPGSSSPRLHSLFLFTSHFFALIFELVA
jgi:hypothetical protein